MSRQKVLFVFCHPDDELICGWPLLQHDGYDKEVLICSSDLNNPLRKKYRHRKLALFALCDKLGIPCSCLDFSSEFYSVPSRVPPRPRGWRKWLPQPDTPFLLQDLCHDILDAMASKSYDAVFTHNFWGEYGHMDHILLNNLIFANVTTPVYVTDMRIPLNWLPMTRDAGLYTGLLGPHFHSQHSLDVDFYEACASIYREKRVWSWSNEPLTQLNLYLFQPGSK